MADPLEFESRLGQALKAKGWSLAVAESCTGGLVGHRITQVAGSSDYFLGGIISYSNLAKQTLLGVAESTLSAHGAVSKETALEMAEGAKRALGSDVAIAITGISGPGGSTPQKPVGLTWVAVVTPEARAVRSFVFMSDRVGNKLEASQSALTMALELVNDAAG